MDPGTLLDHAVFHLTPTRTRCDLLVVSKNGSRDKIASGLLQPFLSHLQFARDQLPKGGYSFSLRPPSISPASSKMVSSSMTTNNDHPPPNWFTRGTLERFVRFVATPEVLERVVTIEREILQIEDSIHREANHSGAAAAAGQQHDQVAMSVMGGSNNRKPTPPSKLNAELDNHDVAAAENSKFCLVRVLENRKMMLQKEQGMAYARASVAGYDKDHIDDLISFANNFGASRLREACMNFKELCIEKEKDKLWLDELAALEASSFSQFSSAETSGVQLTSDTLHKEKIIPMVHTNVTSNGLQEWNGTADNATGNPMINCTSSSAQGVNSMSYSQGRFMATNSHESHKVPMGWLNHPQEYLYAPFGGYAFPGMQIIPPYSGYSENAHRPPSNEESRYRNNEDVDCNQTGSNSKKVPKGECSNSGSESGGSVNHDVSTDDESFTKSRHHGRSSKKSSRKVVIRNINYISSKGRHEENDGSDNSIEDDFLNGDFLRRKVENIVGSLEKHQNSSRHHNRNKGEQRDLASGNGSSDCADKSMENLGAETCNGRKTDESWDSFQNILMREESCFEESDKKRTDQTSDKKQQQVDVVEEYCLVRNNDLTSSASNYCGFDKEPTKGITKQVVPVDPVVLVGRSMVPEVKSSLENFECDDNYCQTIKRRNADEDLLVPLKAETVINSQDTFPNYMGESSALNRHRAEDWFIVTKSDREVERVANGERVHFGLDQMLRPEGQHFHNEKRPDGVIDDSFIAPVREPVDEHSFSLWGADMSIISGDVHDTVTSNHSKENFGSGFHEPDDLQMVLERNLDVERATSGWTPEIDYSADITHTNVDEKDSIAEASGSVSPKLPLDSRGTKNKTGHSSVKTSTSDKKPKPLSGSLTKSKFEVLPRSRKPSTISRATIQMSKAEKEEDNRKRIEELLIERQQRIAQRSATTTGATASKQTTPHAKVVASSLRSQSQRSGLDKLQASQQSKRNGLSHITKSPGMKHIII